MGIAPGTRTTQGKTRQQGAHLKSPPRAPWVPITPLMPAETPEGRVWPSRWPQTLGSGFVCQTRGQREDGPCVFNATSGNR